MEKYEKYSPFKTKEGRKRAFLHMVSNPQFKFVCEGCQRECKHWHPKVKVCDRCKERVAKEAESKKIELSTEELDV